MKVSFSRDIIPSGWLGSKHQWSMPTSYPGSLGVKCQVPNSWFPRCIVRNLDTLQILSRAEALTKQQSLKGVVYVDEDLGNKTAFLVAYDVTLPTVSVTSPSGRVYREIYPEYSLDPRLQMVKILIPRKAEVTFIYLLIDLFIHFILFI